MKNRFISLMILLIISVVSFAQITPPANPPQGNPPQGNAPQGNRPQLGRRPDQSGKVNLDSLRWRDMCIVPDATIP